MALAEVGEGLLVSGGVGRCSVKWPWRAEVPRGDDRRLLRFLGATSLYANHARRKF